MKANSPIGTAVMAVSPEQDSTAIPLRDLQARLYALADEEIRRQLAAGELNQAFRRLHSHYGTEIYRRCLFFMGRDQAAADDAYQLTFISAFESLEMLDDARPIRPWLRGIARHRCLELHARTSRRRELAEFVDLAGEHQELADTAPSPCDAAAAREDWAAVLECTQALRAPYREAFVDYFVSGLSFEELALERDVTAGALKKRASRAVRKVARCLAKRGIESVSERLLINHFSTPAMPFHPARDCGVLDIPNELSQAEYERVALAVRILEEEISHPPFAVYAALLARVRRS